jgi:hypothetical protein
MEPHARDGGRVTGHQPRLGNITDQAARALDLIAKIDAAKQAGPGFWRDVLKQVVTDLDERGAGPDVTRIGDLLAVAYGRLEDKLPTGDTPAVREECDLDGRPAMIDGTHQEVCET